jgi:hypothetical protein
MTIDHNITAAQQEAKELVDLINAMTVKLRA